METEKGELTASDIEMTSSIRSVKNPNSDSEFSQANEESFSFLSVKGVVNFFDPYMVSMTKQLKRSKQFGFDLSNLRREANHVIDLAERLSIRFKEHEVFLKNIVEATNQILSTAIENVSEANMASSVVMDASWRKSLLELTSGLENLGYFENL